jgi:hypothetical protein
LFKQVGALQDLMSFWGRNAMPDRLLFDEAIQRFDAANFEDPRREMFDGQLHAREWLFARRVYEWVQRLTPEPSEALLLAARAHTLRRWMIPRDRYPRTVVGYHEWRGAQSQFHAEQAETILREVGYPAGTIQTVKDLITKANWPGSAEARILEDADCLVFIETKLSDYVDAWGDEKSVHILARTIKKMSSDAQTQALQLDVSPRERELLQRAVRAAAQPS